MPHAGEKKCWGRTRLIFKNGRASCHRLDVVGGYRCSRHYHKLRWNRFFVESGVLHVSVFEKDGVRYARNGQVKLYPGDYYDVAPGVVHRFEVASSGTVYEFYWTDRIPGAEAAPPDERDIVRLDEGGRI